MSTRAKLAADLKAAGVALPRANPLDVSIDALQCYFRLLALHRTTKTLMRDLERGNGSRATTIKLLERNAAAFKQACVDLSELNIGDVAEAIDHTTK